MRLLFSIHVEIMCDHSQLIIYFKKNLFFLGGVKGGGRHEKIQLANFIVIAIIYLGR